jgi:hypothetical protein
VVPGGISTEVVVTQARDHCSTSSYDDVAAVERHRQALELVDDIDRLDAGGSAE